MVLVSVSVSVSESESVWEVVSLSVDSVNLATLRMQGAIEFLSLGVSVDFRKSNGVGWISFCVCERWVFFRLRFVSLFISFIDSVWRFNRAISDSTLFK